MLSLYLYYIDCRLVTGFIHSLLWHWDCGAYFRLVRLGRACSQETFWNFRASGIISCKIAFLSFNPLRKFWINFYQHSVIICTKRKFNKENFVSFNTKIRNTFAKQTKNKQTNKQTKPKTNQSKTKQIPHSSAVRVPASGLLLSD